MKKLRYYPLVVSIGLFLASCWPQASCRPQVGDELKPNKTILKYELKKVNHLTLKPGQVRDAISSINGEFIYLVGKEKASLVAHGMTDKDYKEAVGDFKGFRKAADGTLAGDLSAHRIDKASPTLDGLLFTLSDKKGLVVLRGSGVDNANYYPQDAKIFNGEHVMPLWVKKAADSFIYMFDMNAPNKAVYFRHYIEPSNRDLGTWNDSLKTSGLSKEHFKHVFTAQSQDQHGNLLLADITGIKRVLLEDIGIDKAMLDQQSKPILPIKEFSHDENTNNDHITAMALFDNKYLALGFKSTVAKNGGIIIINMGGLSPTVITKFGPGLSVHSIATERISHPERTRIGAVATVDNGLVFIDNNGKILELVPKKGQVVDAEYMNANQMEIKNYENAQSGFSGDKVLPISKGGYGAVAQDKDAIWYLPLNGNLYTLDIRSEQVAYPKVSPTLP